MGRDNTFDFLKSIALLAMIIGHMSFLGMPQVIVDACYSFSMPLFFIVSGYFSRREPFSIQLLKKQAHALLAPYVITSVIVVIAMTANALFLGSSPFDAVRTWSLAAIYGAGGSFSGMPEGVIGIGAIWFLLALFWAKLLLASCNEMKHPALWVVMLFLIGSLSKDRIWLPLSIQPGFCATIFLYIGQKINESGLLAQGALPSPLILSFGFVGFYAAAYCGHLYMVSCTFENGVIDIIGGVAITVILYRLCKLIDRAVPQVSRAVAFFGRNSLPIFCMHLVELNAFPWAILIDLFGWGSARLLLASFLIHIVSITILVVVLYCFPRIISAKFFASRSLE